MTIDDYKGVYLTLLRVRAKLYERMAALHSSLDDIYEQLSPEDQREVWGLASLWNKQFFGDDNEKLKAAADELTAEAQRLGLYDYDLPPKNELKGDVAQ
jgi:hypothetical protein